MQKMLLIFSAISLNCIASQSPHNAQSNSFAQTSSHNSELSLINLMTEEGIQHKIDSMLAMDPAKTDKKYQQQAIMPNNVAGTIKKPHKPEPDLSNKAMKRYFTTLVHLQQKDSKPEKTLMAIPTINAKKKFEQQNRAEQAKL